MKKLATKQKKPKFDYNVYVACSLTHASQEFRDKVEYFKDQLSSICNVLHFGGLCDRPAHGIYKWDIHECVYKSDLIVAICDLPSTGLGYEIGTQVEARGALCLGLAHEKALVTDLILDTRQPHFEFRRYKDLLTDGLDMVVEKLEKMAKSEKIKKPRRAITKVK